MPLKKRLMLFGLTQHEATVYSALVSIQRAKAIEIMRMTGLHRQHVYAALNRLVKRGMVISNKGKISVFSAVDPEIALGVRFVEAQKGLQVQAETLAELTRLYKERADDGGPLDFIEVMRGPPEQLVARQVAMFSQARKQVRIMFHNDPEDASEAGLSKLDNCELDLLRRGVTVRCICEKGILENPVEVERIRLMVREGERSRVIDCLPMNLLVIDDTCTLFNLSSPRRGRVVYVVNDSSLIGLLGEAFESLWAKSRDIQEYIGKTD